MMNTQKKSGTLSTIVLIIVFIIGLSVLLYPSLSNYYNAVHQSHAIASYDTLLSQLGADENRKLISEAEAYNKIIAAKGLKYINGDPQDEYYKSILNIDGSGMMGYISIKKLQVTLPIYHGTSEAVLSVGAGHLEGSSIPIGGESTHAVLTGHRGLPSAKLFTDLDQLEKGDTFILSVLGQTLTYEVDDIQIVTPYEAELIQIVPGEDHVTLITCTPYAVNTHRLLVRGKRIDTPEQLVVLSDAMKLDPVIVSPIVAAPMLLILLLILLFSPKRKELRLDDVKKLTKDGDKNEAE